MISDLKYLWIKEKIPTQLRLLQIGNILIIVVCLWMSITTGIQAFIKPELTQTELLLRIPNSFVLDFEPRNEHLNIDL